MNYPAHLLPSPFQARVNPVLEAEDFTEVSGQAVPLWLTDIEAEYSAFRTTAGMIDFSMLYKWELSGPTVVDTLNSVFSRDVDKLDVGSIAYGVVVYDNGMMLDDCTVLRYSPNAYRLTGGNPEVEVLLRERLGENTISEVRSTIATLSLQGPRSREILQRLTSVDLSNEAFPYYTFQTDVPVAGIPAHINRMGFTAELGFEIMVAADKAIELWDAVKDAGSDFGVVECGAISLMMVRVEAGMIMAELEYDNTVSPYECRMGWAVDLDKGQFQGRDALVALKESARHTVASVVIDGPPDGLDGLSLNKDGINVGLVTMAIPSPQLGGATLALARVKKGYAAPGTELVLEVGDEIRSARVVSTPVYDPERTRVRS